MPIDGLDTLPELLSRYQDCRSLAEAELLVEKIIDLVGPELSRYIRSRFPWNSPKNDAWEDAYQETLVGIVETLPSFGSADADRFMRWCYGFARHKIADQFRGRKTTVQTLVDPELLREALAGFIDNKSLSPTDRADLEAAMDLIKKSDPPCVNYLWDRFVVGLSFALLGEELGITEAAATKRVQRCLKLARKLIKE